MSAIQAVLLVPGEGDPLGLLKGGPCGTRPPAVWLDTRPPLPGYAFLSRWTLHGGPSGDHVGALVLAWDGEPVPEGCFSLRKAGVCDLTNVTDIETIWRTTTGSWSELIAGFGTIVLLDADGREVTP